MSILAAGSTTRPEEFPPGLAAWLLGFFILLSLLSIFLFVRTVWLSRTTAADWPVRFGPADSLLKLFLLPLGSFFALTIFASIAMPLVRDWPKEQANFVAGIIGTCGALVVTLAANAFLRRDGTALIGLSPRGILPGLFQGLIGIAIILPWLFWYLQIADTILHRLKLEVPTEHEIFKMWQEGSTSNQVRIISYIAAVFIAPIFEEVLFRGLIQTALSRLFTRGSIHYERLQASLPAPMPSADGSIPILPYSNLPPLTPPRFARFLAIFITAVFFAIIHQPWFIQPPIFLLALALGYLYERTGNLWANIFMHLYFNAFEFSLFLLTLHFAPH